MTINYTVTFESGDTATAADLSSTTGSITIFPFSTSGYIDIPVIDDTAVEGPETFHITLTSATGAHLSTTADSACGTINDNDLAAVNHPPKFVPENPTVKVRRNEGLNNDVPTADAVFFLTQRSIASVSADPQDPGQTVTYAITSGNEGNLFRINPNNGKVFANVPGIQLNADQYILQITATDNDPVNPLSATTTLTLNVADVVMITGKTIVIEGDTLQLEFRRYTSNPDSPIDVPFTIVDSRGAPGSTLEVSNRVADINDFDPSDDCTTLFTTGVVHFAADSGGTSVFLTLRATPDSSPEGVEGFQVKLSDPSSTAGYDIWDEDDWNEDLPNDGRTKVGGGSVVPCFVVDGLTLFAKNNPIVELLDIGTVSPSNPGISVNDVNQGGIGDCYLMAALAAFVGQDNGWKRIQNIMHQTGPTAFSVDLYKPTGQLKTYNVTLDLSRGYSAAELSGDFTTTGNTDLAEVWPMVLEQAIGQLRAEIDGTTDTYAAISAGNTAAILQALAGPDNVDADQTSPPLTPAQLAQNIRQAFQAGKSVVLATSGGGTIVDPITMNTVNISSTHAYAVIGVSPTAIQLFDQRQRIVRSFWISNSDFGSISGALTITTATPPAP